MLFELEGVVALVVFGVWFYALYDVITTEEPLIRNLPKVVWVLLVIGLFDIGAIAWFLLGRPQGWQFATPKLVVPSNRTTRAEPSMREDRSIDGAASIVRDREERARMRVWEAQLKRREEELRRREQRLENDLD